MALTITAVASKPSCTCTCTSRIATPHLYLEGLFDEQLTHRFVDRPGVAQADLVLGRIGEVVDRPVVRNGRIDLDHADAVAGGAHRPHLLDASPPVR